MNPDSSFLTLLKKYKLPLLILAALLVLTLIVVIFTTSSPEDGVTGDDSHLFDNSLSSDLKVLEENYGIYSYLPLTSEDPSYIISYSLDNKEGNYSFALTLNAFSASAREKMVSDLLSADFGSFDPLDYDIILENYYNPLSSLELSSLLNSLPENFSVSKTYKLGNYEIYTLLHHLYDGSINTYRAVLKDGVPLLTPALFYNYSSLPFLDHASVRSINSLD